MATETLDIEPIKDAVWQKVADLQKLILANDPQLPGHLSAIHKNLTAYEELVHLLTDEQIREIIKGQKLATGTMLVQKVKTTSTASLMKQAKAISAEDL